MTDVRADREPVLVTEGVRFSADAVGGIDAGIEWSVPDLVVAPGEWLALAPSDDSLHVDTAVSMARTLASMQRPLSGRVQLLGRDVYALPAPLRQRMRARIGYVHGDGGLLSNRSIHDNVALPYSVHRRPTPREERTWVGDILEEFGLSSVAELRPHLVNGLLRWRACLARSVVLDPAWLVIEGPKDWSERWPEHACWPSLQARRERHGMSVLVCLPRAMAGFERWFESEGGRVARCHGRRAGTALDAPIEDRV